MRLTHSGTSLSNNGKQTVTTKSSPNIWCCARQMIVIALFVFTASVITACGSSSNGGAGDVADEPGPTINGVVTAPGGMVAMLENQSLQYALLEVVFPSARADIIGLQPVGGATVELIEIDNDGNQVGDVLASTSTSITGDYTLTLPAGLDFAANLVVRITGAGSEVLTAQVVEQVVDINPITTFVLEKLVEGGTQLDTLAVGEVVRLTGRAEEFDLTAGADLEAMLAVLDAEVGGFLEDAVTELNADPGDGSGVEGSYNNALFSVGLFNDDHFEENGSRTGNFSADIELGALSIEDAGNGELTATWNGGDSYFANLGISNSQPPNNTWLWSETELDDLETETIPMTIDANGVIRVTDEFEEDLIVFEGGTSGIGFRSPPVILEFVPAGPDNDLFVANTTFSEVRYNLTDTNDDGIVDALDPAAQIGVGAFLDLEFFARIPDAFPSLDGDWGLISLEVDLGNNGNIFAGVCKAEVTISGNNATVTGTLDHCQDVDRAPGAAGGLDLVPTDEGAFNATLTPGGNGAIAVLGEGETLPDEGFVNAGGDFMALFFAEDNDDGGDPANLTNLSRGVSYGVRLGSTAPDLTGRSYRLMSQEIWFEETGAVSVSRVSDATLTFNSNADATLSPNSSRIAVRATDVDGPVSVNDESANAESVAVTLSDNGAITFTLAEGVVIDGFVSADRNLLLLRNTFEGDGNVDIGLVVGVPATL